jgi:hypothetical protein
LVWCKGGVLVCFSVTHTYLESESRQRIAIALYMHQGDAGQACPAVCALSQQLEYASMCGPVFVGEADTCG